MTTNDETTASVTTPAEPGSGFDPYEIAAKARAVGDDPLRTVVGNALGYASACWDNLQGAGVFESTRAAAAMDALVAWLEGEGAGRTVRVEPGERLVLRMTDAAWAHDGGLPELVQSIEDAVEHERVLVVAPSIEAFVLAAGVEIKADVAAEPAE